MTKNSEKQIIFLTLDQTLLGGIERVVANLANDLALNGFSVKIFSLLKKNSDSNYQLGKNIKTEFFCKIKVIFFFYKLIAILFVLSLRVKKTDEFVLVSTYPLFSILIGLLRPDLRRHTIASEHSPYFAHKGVVAKLRLKAYKLLRKVVVLTKADCVIFNHHQIDAITIPNAVSVFDNRRQFGSSTSLSRDFVCIGVGRLNKVKRFDLFLEVATRTVKLDPSIKFQIVGSGDELEKLQRCIINFSLSTNVEIIPATNHIEKIYERASVILMTSKMEAFPMVLIEANSFGLPALSIDCPVGPAEIIQDGVNGFLFKESDLSLIANKIVELKRDSELYMSLSHNALQSSSKYKPELITKQWLKLFEGLNR